MSIITIRLREIVRADGSRARSLHVFCPRRLTSIAPSRCAPCGCRCPNDPESEAVDASVGPLAVAARVYAGTASSQHVVSVREDMRLQTVRETTLGVRAVALPVVDDDGVLMGTLARSDLGTACENPRAFAWELARPAFAIRESSRVDEAIAQMTAHHLRMVPIVDAERRVTGALSDIDVLRWVARGAPPLWRTVG